MQAHIYIQYANMQNMQSTLNIYSYEQSIVLDTELYSVSLELIDLI